MTLKNLPESLLGELREAAVSERRSLNQEATHLLLQALRERRRRSATGGAAEPHPQARAQVAAWRELAGTWQSNVSRATEAKRIYAKRSKGRKVAL